MHISSGKFEGIELEDPKNCTPTSCRTLTVKEEIFTVIGNRVLDASVLDINDSNGMYGIESLSRGANCVRFINENKSEKEVTYENISRVGLNPKELMVNESLKHYLDNHNKLGCQKKTYDIVFFEAYRPEDFDCIKEIIFFMNFTGILVMIYPFHNNFHLPKDIPNGEVTEVREVEDKKVAIILKNKIEKS
jgi:16S rRNA G966 N2-methylase RsmD